MATSILRNLWMVTPKGGVPVTDVRDLAMLHAKLMEKGRGPKRYIAPSTNMQIGDVMDMMSTVTGRTLRTLSLPAWALLWPMRGIDLLQQTLPFRIPINFQEVYCVGLSHTSDDSSTRAELGIEPRPPEETLRDTISWMAQMGHVPSRLVGRLA